MKLNKFNKAEWKEKGYIVADYQRDSIIENTKEHPEWIHFGAGNIFRAFPAHLAQQLLCNGNLQTGIVVVEGFDQEILDIAYTPYENRNILVTLKSNGTMEKEVIESVVDSLHLDRAHPDFDKIKSIFCQPSLQMASFTITEKGYQLFDSQGIPFPEVQKDFRCGPMHANSYIGKVVALLYERYRAGKYPIAFVSLDNCSQNGKKLHEAVKAFAKAWIEFSYVEEEFYQYICDSTKVSFPYTMIDKITPRPSDAVIKMLDADGVMDMQPKKTSKGTYIAPFVNAEEAEYLVIEDVFPNGRPLLENVGVFFCTREVVEKVEQMKVCTCLNPLHTTMAIFGCLFNHETIYQCMQDVEVRKLVEKIGYTEGLPVVIDPGIIHPKEFIDEVIEKRFMNPFMPDTPQRIATDTSMKMGIRFGETIKAYSQNASLSPDNLKFIPFVMAGWLRYLLGVDDDGTLFSCSDDPQLAWLQECLKDVTLGCFVDVHRILKPILSNQKIFEVDLYEMKLTEKIEHFFHLLIKDKGAVRSTLRDILK